MQPSHSSPFFTSWIRLAAILSFVLLCLAAPSRAGTKLYATGVGGVGGLSGLYSIDPGTGAATLEWYIPGIHLYSGGLAYDASTDTLYATGVLDSDTGTSRLFIINRFTGAVTTFPGMSSTINVSQGGLAINPLTGVMYATGFNGSQGSALFTIDKGSGAATLVGLNGPSCCVAPYGFIMYGLGFQSDGALFANGLTLTNVPNDSHLYTLDLASGLATDIGPHGVTVGRQLYYSGLAFGANGTLYSLGSISASAGGFYSVDPASGAATIIGATVAGFGVDGGLVFAPDGLPTEYCTAKVNSQSCLPEIGWSGAPSASSSAPFLIRASSIINQKPGLMIYGTSGAASIPFQGGTLCVAPPVTRTGVQQSGGTVGPDDCSGTFSMDFNAWIQSGVDPALVPGGIANAQYWYRDPPAAFTSGLSDALVFTIGS